MVPIYGVGYRESNFNSEVEVAYTAVPNYSGILISPQTLIERLYSLYLYRFYYSVACGIQ